MTSNHSRWAALVLATVASVTGHAEPASPEHDFDFLIGTWKIKNRVLDGWGKGSTTWYEYDATAIERPIWGGAGNVEEWDGVSPKRHVQGLAVRIYDATAGHWNIYWADRSLGTVLPSPVVGTFKDGRGEFFSDESFNGRPARWRIIWTRLSKDSLRWEQAISFDGGTTWETNWIMNFRR